MMCVCVIDDGFGVIRVVFRVTSVQFSDIGDVERVIDDVGDVIKV